MLKVRPRILHSLATVGWGGVERRHLALIERLDGFEHAVICESASGPVAARLKELGVPLLELGPSTRRSIPRRVRDIRHFVRCWGSDIVHGAIIDGYVPGVLAARSLSIPCIIEEASDPVGRRAGGHALVWLTVRLATRVIGVSRPVTDYLLSRGSPPERTQYLTNPVIPPSAAVEVMPRTDPRLVVGFVGRLQDEQKRVSDLIRAAERARSALQLLIVGDGPDRSALERLARDLGIASRTRFVGSQANVWAWLAQMDAFCMPSAREAFGLAAAEASFAGLPVVATRVGGLADVVEDGKTGLLVGPGDVPSIASALDELAENPVRRGLYGLRGQERARRLYSIDRYISSVKRMYAGILTDAQRMQSA